MTDRDSVIEALEQAIPFMRVKGYGAVALIMLDALELLKEQEPVEPVFVGDVNSVWWYGCGACNRSIDPLDMFCRYCGRRVK